MEKIVPENDGLSTGVFVMGMVVGGLIAVAGFSGLASWIASGPISGPILAAALAMKSNGK